MACPYFCPLKRFDAWQPPAVLPLGDAWSGTCRSDPDAEYQPCNADLKAFCNFGYARGRCAHVPSEPGPDAVRFAVRGQEDGLVRILWSREREHRPFDHGTLEYAVAEDDFTARPAGWIFEQQARAYIQSYLRRKARVRR
ncbi:MAG: hypothetical protein M1436_09540 [Acidobacteria bacterium]|nr:hypothetical protein [Acidobacteriota bacterium]